MLDTTQNMFAVHIDQSLVSVQLKSFHNAFLHVLNVVYTTKHLMWKADEVFQNIGGESLSA